MDETSIGTPQAWEVPRGDTRVVLVLGAGGFIGGYVVAALRRHGWRVLRGLRGGSRASPEDARDCDLMRLRTPQDWMPVLEGVDAVVNAAGILHEVRGQSFEVIHHQAPLALAQACVARGGMRLVQISALGTSEDGVFVASKHRFDAALQALPLSSVVLRPSLVYSATGSYGGTSLLRALAGFPGLQLLPGDGQWLTQPLATEDLGELVARAAGSDVRGVFEVGGPVPISLRDYQREWRRWLRIPGERALNTPQAWVSAVVAIGERFGRGPVGQSMWRMLRRGNVAAADAPARLLEQFGFRARTLTQALTDHPSQVQDRWQAQLYFLAPVLRAGMVALWLLSGVVGLSAAPEQIQALAGDSALSMLQPLWLARAGGVLDLLLGLWLCTSWRPRLAVLLMVASVLTYTAVFGVLLPQLWLDPLGGLVKNLALLPALAVLWVLLERR